ncbi:30S ribosomal protein S3ae [Halococcus hamelinensis]|uniref:Small ribosomal subunit protein eS1 n=1 Tax=Halococcus hamelinensis 100A6 TaxID=1132509 RepID=M0MAJ2_9EURY|nr:30S ribosomal protein S3ae [Halococcus hamelinensis]EMA41410.1 30S ribosomal protein S3Ae [Halococcus hamelinensis 100A6]
MSERSVSRQQRQKRWYTVLAPESFDRAELGTTPANEPNAVLERTIEATLGDLTDDAGANNVKLTFRINDVGSDTAYTEFEKHELTRDYLNSLVRRGASKVDAYLTVRTNDNYRVRIQPVAFTTQKANDSQEKAIRKRMVELVREAAHDRSFQELVDSVTQGRLSSAIYGEARTIYPLRRVEVAKLALDAHPEEIAEEEETAVDVDESDVEV